MTELLKEGLVLMGIGMGVVFVLLTLLVFVVQGVSKLSGVFAPAGIPPPASPSADRPATVDEEIVSAISTAIGRHRRRRGDKS